MFDNTYNNVFIGIDPGADGGVVVLSDTGKVIEKYTVPKKTVKSTKPAKDKDGKNKKDSKGRLIYNDKKIMDEVSYCFLIRTLRDRFPKANVFLEKVKSIGANPRQKSVGATQNFSFGYNFGLINGFVIACGFSKFTLVTPQEWQKQIIKPQDKVLGPEGKNDNKSSALNAFKRIYPNTDMRASSRSTFFHDGLVDAALIALWGLIQSKEDEDEIF